VELGFVGAVHEQRNRRREGEGMLGRTVEGAVFAAAQSKRAALDAAVGPLLHRRDLAADERDVERDRFGRLAFEHQERCHAHNPSGHLANSAMGSPVSSSDLRPANTAGQPWLIAPITLESGAALVWVRVSLVTLPCCSSS